MTKPTKVIQPVSVSTDLGDLGELGKLEVQEEVEGPSAKGRNNVKGDNVKGDVKGTSAKGRNNVKGVAVKGDVKGGDSPSVFAWDRRLSSPDIRLPRSVVLNERMKMDGLKLLAQLPDDAIPLSFFDPQYRGVLDKLSYGNEGQERGRERSLLTQMSEEMIARFITGIDRVLMPSGHVFLWMDKFHLCTGFTSWLSGTKLEVVDMLTWHKTRMGMGYRTRRMSEHIVILQKKPRRAKGVWTNHRIADVVQEAIERPNHTHRKPIILQRDLIMAVSHGGDIVLDPAAGSFSVLEACQTCAPKRNFLGCDLNG